MIEEKLHGFFETDFTNQEKADKNSLVEVDSEDKPKDLGIATDHSVMIYGWGNDP